MGHPSHPLTAWRVLDTDFGSGAAFLKAWRTWQVDPGRTRILHYVALCEAPCDAVDMLRSAQADSSLTVLAQELGTLWYGLLPGFHRFLLDHGQVVFTLCVGEPISLLRAQQFEADSIEFAAGCLNTTTLPWLVKAMVRCCRRGTALMVRDTPPALATELRNVLSKHGFQWPGDCTSKTSWPTLLQGEFSPPWVIKNTRHTSAQSALPIERCAVIGAGLAGASVAAALARRGWQVQVLDRAGNPAAGASGLPVGLVVPHVSSDDCQLSRLSRAGVRLMLQQARELLEIHQDWAPSGVMERQIGGTPKLPASWSIEGKKWFDKFQPSETSDAMGPGLWHTQGAWIKPAALVAAWLKQPGVTFQGHAEVAHVRRHSGCWDLLDAAGTVLGRAERVVFANACGAFSLLQNMQRITPEAYALWQHLPKIQGMRGLLNWGMHSGAGGAGFPPFPVNGSGSVIPNIPTNDGMAWFMGSTYQPETQAERTDFANQSRNFEHFEQLLPTLAAQLADEFSAPTLHSWKGMRCVTADRLPAVGPLDHSDQPGLWLCAGMGSRGLSFSVLCAELLAAHFGAEPLPIDTKLARSLDALRT